MFFLPPKRAVLNYSTKYPTSQRFSSLEKSPWGTSPGARTMTYKLSVIWRRLFVSNLTAWVPLGQLGTGMCQICGFVLVPEKFVQNLTTPPRTPTSHLWRNPKLPEHGRDPPPDFRNIECIEQLEFGGQATILILYWLSGEATLRL